MGAIQYYRTTMTSTQKPFISAWKTDNVSVGSSGPTQVSLPLKSTGVFNFTVEWGDGSSDKITAYNQLEATHTYNTAGTYIVTITGKIIGWGFGNDRDRLKILEISQWGGFIFSNVGDLSGGYFWGCSNLNITATDVPNLTTVKTMFRAFYQCSSLVFNPSINNWDMSAITDVGAMFQNAVQFNQPLNNWNTSNFTSLEGLFFGATIYNQPLNNWDTSNVISMNGVFRSTGSFNQDLSSWDTSKVTSITGIFYQATAFNGDVSTWDTSNITSMAGVFRLATSFNQPLNSWNVSNVTAFGGNDNGMFYGAASFNQPLNNWNVANATNMIQMFRNASAFDQYLGSWHVVGLEAADGMFYNASLSTANYDALLIGWSAKPLKSNVTFNAGNSTYSSGTAASARQYIIDTFNWVITDGGPA